MDILRFITAGSVDDGKSTLIGRLLYDTNNIKSDVLQSVSRNEGADINLAHITDGLRAERQHGITIDVAYKYFTTPKRKYIVTDAPGHLHYTRNLVTGSSGVDAMIVLIDAQNGITDQTRRHSLVASFLGIGHVVVAINKMDLVGYKEQVFAAIKNEYIEMAHKLSLKNITFIPLSALLGDNVSFPSGNMDWYKGETLMHYLENCEPANTTFNATRFSAQYVDETSGVCFGKVLSGVLKSGDEVLILPGDKKAIVDKITTGYDYTTEAQAGQNISLSFRDDIAMTRGQILSSLVSRPAVSTTFTAEICWLDAEHALQPGKEYILRINAQETICFITGIIDKMNVTTFEKYSDGLPLEVNQFASVTMETKQPVPFDPYTLSPEGGRGIIIDATTNYTSGAFVISANNG